MKKLILVISVLTVLLFGFKAVSETVLDFPEYFGEPTYDFSNNELSPKVIELGRFLFFDPLLSKDNTISCASCHSPYNAFAHTDHNVSHGIGDSIGTRNAPGLFNLAWHTNFQWDGASHHLDVQPLAPIEDPREMGESFAHVVEKIASKEHYTELFQGAFSEDVTGELVLKSISQFQLSLISANSKFDQFLRGEVNLMPQELIGFELFNMHCNACHTAPLFTNLNYENNGLTPDSVFNDLGRHQVTQKSADSLKFKVPSLRNLAYTKPYMHDGRFSSLREILNHYSDGIHVSETLNPLLIDGIALSDDEKTDLISFLITLNDKDFVFNPTNKFPQKLKKYIK